MNISNLIGFDNEICLSYEYTQSLKMRFYAELIKAQDSEQRIIGRYVKFQSSENE